MQTRLLKILAVTAFGAITFPLIFTNDTLAFGGMSALRLLAYYAAFGGIFAFGYLFGGIGERGKLFLFLARVVGGLTFFFALILLFFTQDIMLIAAAGASAVFWYFLGERAVKKNYADFFPMFAFGVYIVLTLLCYIFYGAVAPDELRDPVRQLVIVSFMLEICLVALLINQSGIYDKASRRRETRTMLPKGLSGYNAALVLAVTLAGLGLYVFSDKIIWLFKELLKLFFNIFAWFIGLLSFEDTELVTGDSMLGGGAYANESRGSMAFIYIVFIVLVIVFRKAIRNAIKEAVKAIYAFFIREQEKSGDDPGFVDRLEQTVPKRRIKNKALSDQALYKKYRAENSPELKFRFGYRLLLRKMERGGAKLIPSDTAASQLEKGKKVYGERLCGVVECYNTVRYNGEKPGPEKFAELEEVLNGRA